MCTDTFNILLYVFDNALHLLNNMIFFSDSLPVQKTCFSSLCVFIFAIAYSSNNPFSNLIMTLHLSVSEVFAPDDLHKSKSHWVHFVVWPHCYSVHSAIIIIHTATPWPNEGVSTMCSNVCAFLNPDATFIIIIIITTTITIWNNVLLLLLLLLVKYIY